MPDHKITKEFLRDALALLEGHDTDERKIAFLKKAVREAMLEPSEVKENEEVWDLVLQDIDDRRAYAVRKYAKPFTVFDGRDSLIDLYQELLDAVVYTRKAIYEREEMVNLIKEALELVQQGGESSDFVSQATTVLNKVGGDRPVAHKRPEDTAEEIVNRVSSLAKHRVVPSRGFKDDEVHVAVIQSASWSSKSEAEEHLRSMLRAALSEEK